MRIGFDAKRAFFNRSGLGNYSRWFIDALTQLHPENEYFLFKLKEEKGIDFNGASHSKIITPNTFLHKSLRTYWRASGVTKDIRRTHLDIFHGLSHELPIGIGKTQARSVVTMHDAIFMRFPQLFDTGYRIIFRNKYQHALKVADGIIAISQQSKDDIVEYFDVHPDRIKIIYQGCNPIYYNTAEKTVKEEVKQKYNLPGNYILYVGTIEPRKNLLGVFEALVNNHIDIPVVAVGRPTAYLDKIKRFVSSNKIEDKAIFLHNVETAELPAIYQMAGLFVYPSMFEGFGIPILEALNSGTPVVTSKGSCFPEVGGKAARYAEYGNAEELGQLIKSILDDSALQNSMIEEGKKQSLKFREEKVSGELISYYKEVIKQ